MSDFEGVHVSRADIARFAGVKRPAVTNWERRHADFPQPLGEAAQGAADIEVFSAVQVLAWLDRRAIPANARRSDEPEGTTYGDRFRASLGGTRTGALLKAVDRLSGAEAERFRGELSQADYVTVLLTLVYVRGCLPEEWQRILTEVRRFQFPHSGELLVRILASGVRRGLGPEHERLLLALSQNLGDSRVVDTILLLDDTGPVDLAEHAQAFERLMVRYSDLMGRRAGDFFTPRAAVDVLTKLVADGSRNVRSVHDPFVRAGELLLAAWDAVADAQGSPPEASGAGVGEHPLALAGMNLALHGVPEARLRTGSTAPSAGNDPWHQGFDRIVTNPPFNVRLERPVGHGHWRYGTPPQHNANFDWLQYAVTCLRRDGRAAVLMPDIAAFSANTSERRIRAAMVEDGAVEALIALPAQLFTTTGIRVTIWLLRHPTGTCDEILFVDASHLGSLVSRVQRELAGHETQRILEEYRAWIAARAGGSAFAGTEGLSRSVSIEKIREKDYTLSPAFYVPSGTPTGARSVEPADLAALAGQLTELHSRARDADSAVEELLGRYGL
ncbi:N-6 DNA methylase [Streptomyces fodineus]|uniref:N-6 DNA methylase n=1 Tax=Streptomyces fodineus TaxID=1904616 RepID=A0A1D7YDA0_9ACTN|nr:N-6 DNA methylase [Streptomyces fodineus]AOR33531.1 N-6 DNA methylase [Streptomyces fodineus]